LKTIPWHLLSIFFVRFESPTRDWYLLKQKRKTEISRLLMCRHWKWDSHHHRSIYRSWGMSWIV